jgi:hypothetical protein
MKIETSSGIDGSWVDKKSLKNGDLVKLKTEATWKKSGKEGMPDQLVAKMRVKGSTEDVNVAINTPTRNALINAYGDDSLNWIDKVLTVQVESGIFAGKRGIMLNLVPEGYVLREDAAGYLQITPKVTPPNIVGVARGVDHETGIDAPGADFDPDAIPF